MIQTCTRSYSKSNQGKSNKKKSKLLNGSNGGQICELPHLERCNGLCYLEVVRKGGPCQDGLVRERMNKRLVQKLRNNKSERLRGLATSVHILRQHFNRHGQHGRKIRYGNFMKKSKCKVETKVVTTQEPKSRAIAGNIYANLGLFSINLIQSFTATPGIVKVLASTD